MSECPGCGVDALAYRVHFRLGFGRGEGLEGWVGWVGVVEVGLPDFRPEGGGGRNLGSVPAPPVFIVVSTS